MLNTRYSVEHSTLILRFPKPRRVLSSAVLGGGLRSCNFVLNHQIPSSLRGPERQVFRNPSRYLRTVATALGLKGRGVGLMTAVPMDRLVCVRREARNLWVEGFITVGTANAVRAGDPATADLPVSVGTINIILVTNVRLTSPAMVEAVQVVTEAKTATLAEAKVFSKVSGVLATGTGTDATVILSGHGPRVQYVGTHTRMGALISRAVVDGVLDGVRPQSPTAK